MKKTLSKFKILSLSVVLCSVVLSGASQKSEKELLFKTNGTTTIYLDQSESELVHSALSMLQEDVAAVFNAKLVSSKEPAQANVIAGTVGKSEVIAEMVEAGLVDISPVKDQWESYLIKNVKWKGQSVLLVAGSDSRATAYGLIEISRMIGVSPWVWWADVPPAKQDGFEISDGLLIQDAPKVKFRGIFLNDEDWGLQPWAAKTFEPETGDIGPKTYEKIFQLLLRLKANTIWPAMHPSTKAFYTIPGNKEMAAKYQIFVGTSHAEPMLRNNVGEWDRKKYGAYDYSTNRDVVKNYWQERIQQLEPEDKYIVTLGMRGIHDSGMQGNYTKEEKVDMLETIISDQRKMLENVLKKDVTKIPQAFVPYKEVLEIYSDGARVPEDATLVWPDDNHGYIRQLSNTEERKRSGGGGVYYHISYWGRPHDFLWLESVPVSLIWEEMNKAYHTNSKDIWVVNVGDIKPTEIGMSFFLEMAWNPEQFSPESLTSYYIRFAREQFGDAYANEIGGILKDYFQLAYSRKPEHMGWSTIYPNTPIKDPEFSLYRNGDEVQQRIDAYITLEEQVHTVQVKLPEHLKDAFYQLVAYKVLGASNMNKKMLYAYKSRIYAQQGRVSANFYAEKAKEAFETIKEITNDYNQHSKGKWMHMMTYNPRKLAVYDMPEVGHVEPAQKTAGGIILERITQPVTPGEKASLPTFFSATNRRYFIDVFNAGLEPLKWTAKVKDKWIQLSDRAGVTSTDKRIWVSVDWSRVKRATDQTASIEFKVGNSVYYVTVKAQRTELPAGGQVFVEDNGVVAMEAEHFTRSEDASHGSWKLIQALGRQNDAMGTFPLTASPLDVSQAPALQYEFITHTSGQANLRFYCLPSQPINADYKLRFAVRIDDGEPLIMNAALKEVMDEYNEEWQTNVLRAASIVQAGITIPQAGRHRVTISMIDPGVVLDKIEVLMNEGEEVSSYFGSEETKVQRY